MAKFIYLILIIALGTLWLYILHMFAPSLNNSDVKNEIKFPSSLKELQEVAVTLKAYSINHWWYVLLIFSSAYIYKQSFCVPGSLFLVRRLLISVWGTMNLLAGALYGHIGGLFFACLFTAIGATVCYILSRTFAKDLVFNYFPKRFKAFEQKVHENKDHLLYFMLFIRLVPITPGWVINLVAPLVGVPIIIFFFSTFLGLIPYNFVGVSAGGMLSSLKSINDVLTWRVLLNISAIALVSIGPAYLLKRRTEKSKKVG